MTSRTLGRVAPIVLVLAACATTRPGPERAVEVQGQYVRLLTDLDEAAAIETVGVLDLHHQAITKQLAALSGQPIPPSGKLELIAFHSPGVLGPNATAVAVTDDLGAVVVANRPRSRLLATLTHEMTHILLTAHFGTLPTWLNEGLASYFRTMRPSADRRQVEVGAESRADEPPGFAPSEMLSQRLLPSSEEFRKRRQEVHRMYASFLRFTRFLLREKPEVVQALLQRLRRGEVSESIVAELFPEAQRPELDQRVAEYRPEEVTVTMGVEPGPPPTIVRKLDGADYWALVGSARLRAVQVHDPEARDWWWWSVGQARSLALALDSQNLAALVLDAAGQRRGGTKERERNLLEAIRHICARHPQSGLGWAFLLREAQRGLKLGADERRRALEMILTRLEDNPFVLEIAARELLATGRAAEGLPLAERAVQLDPATMPHRAAVSLILEAGGRCREALEVQRGVLTRLVGVPKTEREVQRLRLAELTGRCGDGDRASAADPGRQASGE